MVLTLYTHPLASCWHKGLIALYELPLTGKTAGVLQDIGHFCRVVFNIAGNHYRLVAWINYPYRVVTIRFIGSHAEYDGIDAQTI